MHHGLALHRWFSGQILTSEHFVFQERALLEHIRLRAELGGLPAHGVASLRLNQAALAEGVVSIERLVLVLTDGRLLALPGNATSITPLALKPDAGGVVYLHVAEPDEEERKHLEATAIEPALFEPFLSLRRDEPRSSEAMALLELLPTRDGLKLGRYSPPLLRVGTTPFLEELFGSVRERVRRALEATRRELAERYLRAQSLSGLLAFEAAAERLLSLFDNSLAASQTEHGVRECSRPHPHPYFMYEALRDFCFATSVSHERPLPRTRFLYDHDDLRATFERLERAIAEQLTVAPDRAPGLAFAREGRLYVCRPLPDEVSAGREAFVSIRSTRPGPPPTLASPSRLETVETNLLPGVPLARVEPPRFVRGASERQFFRIERGPEWRFVVEERALCFRAALGEPALEAELLWTP